MASNRAASMTAKIQSYDWEQLSSMLVSMAEVIPNDKKASEISQTRVIGEGTDVRKVRTAITTGLKLGVAGTWESPEEWVKELRTQLEEMDWRDQAVEDVYGPNWKEYASNIARTAGRPQGTCARMERRHILTKIDAKINEIMMHWKNLKEQPLECFINTWRRMPYSVRKTSLKSWQGWETNTRQPIGLPAFPYQYIYCWAEDNTLEPTLLTAGILNIEELVENLPEFALTRSKTPPRLFFEIDGAAISLGFWSGSLKSFYFDCKLRILPTTEEAFEYSVEDLPSKNNMKELETGFGFRDPWIAYVELEALLRTYKFLNGFISTVLETKSILCEQKQVAPQVSSLFAQDVPLEYDPVHQLNLNYILSLLESSLEEAMSDLQRLRQDPEYWVTRMKYARRKTSTLLQEAFIRIDTFLRLTSLTKDIIKNTPPRDSHKGIPPEGKALDDLTTLHTLLTSTLRRIVASLDDIDWLPSNPKTPFAILLEMVAKNNPTIWAIGLYGVLRVIDRELQAMNEGDRIKIPFRIMQALGDMVVYSVCKRHVQRGFFSFTGNFYAEWKEHRELEAQLQESSTPWKSLIDATLDVIDGPTMQKLDVLHTRQTMTPAQRHNQFWTVVDRFMEDSCSCEEKRSIFNGILHNAPLVAIAATSEKILTLAPSTATQTGQKKSKGKPPRGLTQKRIEPLKPNTSGSLAQVQIILHPERDAKILNFWTDLSNSQGGGQIQWINFLGGMRGLGFTVISQGGSSHRFERKTSDTRSIALCFHRPHASGATLPRIVAHKEWYERVMRCIQLCT